MADRTHTSADVVVVGAGPGGCSAAVEAARDEQRVVLVEAGDEIGGNAARSTGYLAFADFAMQEQAGISDDPEAFLADMLAEVERQSDRYGIIFDEQLAALYAARSAEAYRFLTDLGIGFRRFIPRPRQHLVDRMVDCEDVRTFTTAFARELDRLGVEVRLRTRARQLLTTNGRVTGIVLEDEAGQHTELRADSVVLAAGGYQANPELRRRYQPEHLATTPYLGVDTDRGDGHLMGQAVGGDLINMTMIPPLIMVASAFVERAIAVDRRGTRFHDEAGPYLERVDALLARPERRAHYVYDRRLAQDAAHLIAQMPEPSVSADSLEELAVAIGCAPTGLREAVEGWNRAVAAGQDPQFGRVVLPADGTGIVEPPFHAVPMSVGINFPAGGFRVTTAMQVIDVFGAAIPGLYAAGDCVGGVAPAIGLGGIKIAAAVTLGRVAGAAAAGRVHAEPPNQGAAAATSPTREDRGMVMDVIDPVTGAASRG